MTTFREARRIVADRYGPVYAREGKSYGVSPDGLEDDTTWAVVHGQVDDGAVVPDDMLTLVDRTDGEVQRIPYLGGGAERAAGMSPVVDVVAAQRPPALRLFP